MQLKQYSRGKFIPKCLYLKGGKLKIDLFKCLIKTSHLTVGKVYSCALMYNQQDPYIYYYITAYQRFLFFIDLSLFSNVIDDTIVYLLFQHPCSGEERTGRVHSDSRTHRMVTRSHFSPVRLTIKYSYIFFSLPQ